MSRKKKGAADAADAQVETLVGTEQPAGGAGDGQAAGAAGEPAAPADADAFNPAPPADGGDDAGGEDGRAAGAEAAGADDEGDAAAEGDDENVEMIDIDGELYRKFIRPGEDVDDDGTLRCIRCGQIDEPDFHDDALCRPTASDPDAPFKFGDRVQLFEVGGQKGTVEEVYANHVVVRWDDSAGEQSREEFDAIERVDEEPEAGPMDLDILAACAAAAVVFGTRRSNEHTLPTADYGFIAENPPIRAVAECAAEFVRGNGDVSPAVIPIHLGLKGLRPQEPVTHREYAAWSVFAATLKALDTMRATEAADEEAQARAKAASERRASAPRDRLALMPEEGALTPSGFTPSR